MPDEQEIGFKPGSGGGLAAACIVFLILGIILLTINISLQGKMVKFDDVSYEDSK